MNSSSYLHRVAQNAVPVVADFCLVYVLRGERLQCAAFAHATAAGTRLLRSLIHVYRISRNDLGSTVAAVVRDGRPSLRAEIRPERGNGAPVSARVAELHRRLNVRSSLVVPIKGGAGRIAGAVVLAYSDSRRRYSSSDRVVAQRLARQAAIALEHAPILDELLRHERLLHRRLSIRLRARL